MSFLKNLFRKKDGGTLVGNLFRGVTSKLTGGVSDAINPIPHFDSSISSNGPLGSTLGNGLGDTINQNTNYAIPNAVSDASDRAALDIAKDYFLKYWWALVAFVLGVWYYFKYIHHAKKGPRSSSSRRR